MEKEKEQAVVRLFWENVEWHCEHKAISWYQLMGTQARLAAEHRANITLTTVAKIADKLEIDDFTILFE